jgi:hypothetical protein
MQTLQPDTPSTREQGPRAASRFQQQMEDRFGAFKAEVSEEPFLYLAFAFVTGFVLNTFPAKVLFLIGWRLISWLLGPAILLLGVLKLGDLFPGSRQTQPTVLVRPDSL